MKKITYNAILAPSKDGFGIVFPDLPGCVSFGETIEEANHMAREALSLHLYGMEQDNDMIPEPTQPPYADMEPDMLLLPITVFPDMYRREFNTRAVRQNISMPAWMKAAADSEKLNVSQITQEALLEQLVARGFTPPS